MRAEKWNLEEDGPFSERALCEKIQKRGFRVSRYVYPPGTFFPEHTHDADKIDAVVSGCFLMRSPKGEVVLEDGDLLAVPRGMIHSAEVVGDEAVVSLDGVRR